jgi:hypothetical protein
MVILLLFIVGCDSNYVLQADTTPVETVTVYETVITTEIVEIENTQRVDELEVELQQYKDLISNLNEYLSCVYYGYAINDKIPLLTGPISPANQVYPAQIISTSASGNFCSLILDEEIKAQRCNAPVGAIVTLTPANWQIRFRAYPIR